MRRVPVHERGPKRTYRPDPNSAIAGPQRAHAAIGAFDGPDLAAWPGRARELRAEGVSVVLGLGAGAFDDRSRPLGLRPLPGFPGDELDPRRCGGDACVLIFSDAPTDALSRFGIPRWQRQGTHTPTGALGFRDGTLNPRRPLDLDRHVWVSDRDRTTMLGGTYLVVRDIHIDPSWHDLQAREQERIIGRDKRTGAPLHGTRLFEKPDLDALPEDAHIRQAAPRTSGVTILRRGYDTADGLLLLAFMKHPLRQFVPLQSRLAAHDALHAFQTARGSAVFAIPTELSSTLLYAQ
jgi:deferrochelatase/peroxidase EfeB